MVSDIKFSLLKFKPDYYWSKIRHEMLWMDDIAYIVWEKEDLPVRTEIVSFDEAIDYIKKNPGDSKAHRNAIMRILSERFALKEFVGMENWDGVIYVDLDMGNSLLVPKLSKEKQDLLYSTLDYALQNIAPNNYFYIEHSSSGIGIHIMFYFDCPRTRENHDKYCQWIYDIFRYKIDDYIKDFSKAIFDEINKDHKVFDDVYKRPYQKLFITTKDMISHNVSGYCEDIEVDFVAKEIEDDKVNGNFDVKFITSKKKYNTDYYDRLYIITALKKYVGDYDKCKELWYSFCEQLTLYKKYTTKQFKNMFDQNWNKIDSSTGHLSILKKYGFDVDENKMHIHLNDDEYLRDKLEEIVDFCSEGINLVVAPTGGGKTEGWKGLNKKYSQVLEFQFHKPMLIVEPMNSIIESKYDSEDYVIIKGSKSLKNLDLTTYKCVVTNYNHLIKKDSDCGYSLIDDIEKFFSGFELIIIDESHIMMKDMFRSEVLIPFMQTLNKIKNCKVIIQTATTLFEKTVLDIKKTVIVEKKEKRNIKLIYREVTEDKFDISQIICLTNYYITNGKKVYIYWKDGSLQNMKFLKNLFPDTTIVYHKRDLGSDDMEQINSEHILGETNLMISSVYFGVGNDLNDNVEDAAVIVIGNNIWQEDVQAIGRWRNAKNIEVCVVLLPKDIEFVRNSIDYTFDYAERLRMKENELRRILYDVYNKEKDVIVCGKGFKVKNEEYVHYLANMEVANEYSQQFSVKNEEFRKLGYDVRDIIKPLVINEQWMEELKKYRKDIKEIRNTYFQDFLAGKYDWDKINKDGVLERCAKIIKKMQANNLFKYCDMNRFTKGQILNYGTFLKYYNKTYSENYDFAEVFSILWTRERCRRTETREYSFAGEQFNQIEYYTACGYLIWTYYREKQKDGQYYNIQSFYLKEFEKTVKAFNTFTDSLVERMFVSHVYDKKYNDFVEEFLGSRIEEEEDINQSNLIEKIVRLKKDDVHFNKTVNKVYTYFSSRHKKGASGGNVGKKCIITDKFKNCSKYNLSVGQEFESQEELAQYTGKSVQSVVSWRKKEWII